MKKKFDKEQSIQNSRKFFLKHKYWSIVTFCNIIYQLQQYFFDFYNENKPILSKNRLIFIPVIPGNRFMFPGTSGNEYFREIPGNPGNGIPGNQP